MEVPYKENDKFVRDEETDIQFMIKQSKFDIRYLVMGAYAYSDTEGKEVEEKPCMLHFLDRIATITELTPEITDKPFPLLKMGEYDAGTKRFFLSKNCPSEKENETLLSIFIDYADPEGLNDDIKEELANLRHKISLLDADNIQEMYIQKQRNQIFTYPATPIRYDLNTYLKRK